MQLCDQARRVKVVAEPTKSVRGYSVVGLQSFKIVVPITKNIMRFTERFKGPVNWLTIVGTEHIKAKCLARPRIAMPVFQQLPDGDKIAFGLRHLVAFDLQEAVVHPDVRHASFVKGAAALRQFVLVMRKHQIDAAAMNVELLAEMFPRHRRAFDVQARAALGFDPRWRPP